MQALLRFLVWLFHYLASLFQRGRNRFSDRRWRRLANSVTRDTFLEWLAEQTVRDVLAQRPDFLSVEQLSTAAKEATLSDFQHHAEHFIQVFYHDYPFDDPACADTLRHFRDLLCQKLFKLT